MRTRSYNAWSEVGLDAWMLGAEASTVIGLRFARIAMGGEAGTREATLMVSEKVAAGLELQADLIGAGFSRGPRKLTASA